MVRGIDFERLYQEFGLDPGASVDDLKLAYRRRVSVLHPDRLDARDPISQHLATEHLSRLTSMYEAAIGFHRQHGRLPGAMPSARSAPVNEAPAAGATFAYDTPAPVRSRSLVWWLLALGIIALFAWLIAGLDAVEDSLAPEPVAVPRAALPAPLDRRTTMPQRSTEGIRVGMTAADVLRIEGEPVTRNEYRWDYGPSWIGFDKGKVRDWYSSPLRALRIDKAPAPEPDEAKPSSRAGSTPR